MTLFLLEFKMNFFYGFFFLLYFEKSHFQEKYDIIPCWKISSSPVQNYFESFFTTTWRAKVVVCSSSSPLVDTLFLQNFITLFAGFAICKISFGIGKMSGFKWLWSRTNVAFRTSLCCHWRRFGYSFGCHSRTDCQTTQTEKASQEQNSLKKKKKK